MLTHAPPTTSAVAVGPRRLEPLLAPRSVALVGASRRRHSVGHDMLRNLASSGFVGAVHPVNPRYGSLAGYACYESVSQIPERVDLALLAVPDRALESAAADALAAGARSLVIVGSAESGDHEPSLRARLAAMAADADVPVCGTNCMGLVNVPHGLRAFASFHPEPLQPGGVTYIAQSGSLLQALLFNDERLRFNLAVSTGQELVTTAAEYLEYALEQPSTTAVALVIEAIRDPARFVAALTTARDREIPVVALKLGRTAAGARFALSHTGAVAGDAKVYEALFRQYGVASVRDLNELAATTLLLSSDRRPAPGGLAAVLDSGGERELLVDTAVDEGVRFADISPATATVLRDCLDPGLAAVNPVDAWGTGNDYETVFETCLRALLDDPDTGMAVLVADLCEELDLHDGYLDVCRTVARTTAKPLVVMSNYSAWGHRRHALRLARAGVPVVDGTAASLRAIRHAFAHRDFITRRTAAPSPVGPGGHALATWRRRLASGRAPLTEDEGYALLDAYGIPTPRRGVAHTVDQAVALGRTLGFPVVIKTAEPGVLHKTDVGGVVTDVADEDRVAAAYADLAGRIGPRVLVAEQVAAPVEMAFGLVRDPGFGSFVMVAVGGTMIELLGDAQLAMAPVDHDTATSRIDALTLSRVLDGHRGQPACDRAALVDAFVRVGRLAADLGPFIAEMDINPVFAGPGGVVAADCLIVPDGAVPGRAGAAR
jgi:acyl-CoA synthetase (NDP forming)